MYLALFVFEERYIISDHFSTDLTRKICLLLGWEYTVDTSVASYVAVEKTYHMSRRRRWVRGRNLVKSTEKEDKVLMLQYVS